MRRCLVTGGAGFIGSALVKRLVIDGCHVDVVDDMSSGSYDALLPLCAVFTGSKSWLDSIDQREGAAAGMPKDNTVVPVFEKDFSDKLVLEFVRQGRYEIIFHQAAIPRVAYSVENPIETMQANLLNSCKLFKCAAESGIPVIYASSSSVYGGNDVTPTREEMKGEVLPLSPYAMQKYHMEDYAELYRQLYGLKAIGLRYFNVFGPGQLGDSPYATAVAAWCHAIKNGQECRSDGDGEQTRDMCYIDNVVQANISASAKMMSDAVGQCYNIACGESVSNNEILAHLRERFGDRVKVRHAPPRPGDVKHTLADITFAKKNLDYEVLVPFWEGLRRTLDWWEL